MPYGRQAEAESLQQPQVIELLRRLEAFYVPLGLWRHLSMASRRLMASRTLVEIYHGELSFVLEEESEIQHLSIIGVDDFLVEEEGSEEELVIDLEWLVRELRGAQTIELLTIWLDPVVQREEASMSLSVKQVFQIP
jgi:hypothetical protein